MIHSEINSEHSEGPSSFLGYSDGVLSLYNSCSTIWVTYYLFYDNAVWFYPKYYRTLQDQDLPNNNDFKQHLILV